MDYRSSIADDEHPAASSPWGSSPPASPRRNVTSYTTIGSDATPEPQHSSNGLSDDLNTNAFGRPDTASSTASGTEHDASQASDPSHQSQQSTFGPPLDQQDSEEQGSLQQPQAHGKPPGSGAPAGQEQHRRSNYPQFKLQGKITGLERTGRKDPILRFDVHVSQDCWTLLRCFWRGAAS